ncbi:MAG: DUF2617 family protein, partial [Planctomycetota bacterium]
RSFVLVIRPKIAELNFMLFGRSIHPELFNACAVRHIERENYSLDLNITSDGHLIVFQHNGLTLAEVSAGNQHPLPEKRMLLNHSIKGSQTDHVLFRDSIDYQCEFQRDKVAAKTVLAIQQQLPDVDCSGLVHRFQSSGRMAFGALSYIDIQAFRKHVQIRTFHTFPDTCSIVKSQSVFRLCDREMENHGKS